MMKNGRKEEQRQRGFSLSDPLISCTRWWGRVFLTPGGSVVSPLSARLANEGKVSDGDQAGGTGSWTGEGGEEEGRGGEAQAAFSVSF